MIHDDLWYDKSKVGDVMVFLFKIFDKIIGKNFDAIIRAMMDV